MNVKCLQGAASLELAEGFQLRRATASEIIDIKATLNILPSADNTAGLPVRIPNIWERPIAHRGPPAE
jgi:hypothetical protein